MPISDTTREEAQRLARRYPVARSALLPMLHLVQSDEGYVTEDGIALCSQLLGLTKAEVGAVSTFYTMFKREPVGDYLLSVCTNPTCKIAGAQDIYDSYVDKCGGAHHTEEGAGVTVEHAECLGICDAAPVVQVNYEMYGPVTHEQAMELFDQSKAGEPPASNWSNEVPANFRAVERELSGIEDGTDAQLIEAARMQALAAVPPAYRTGETDLPVTHPGGDPLGHGGEAFRNEARLENTEMGPGSGGIQPEDAAMLDEVGEQATGTAQELADQATEPAPASPAAEEQGEVPPSGGTTSAPSTDRAQTAAGSEAAPGGALGGEQDTPDEPPTGRQPDVEPGESRGEPTGQGDDDLRTYQGERRADDPDSTPSDETGTRPSDDTDEEG